MLRVLAVLVLMGAVAAVTFNWRERVRIERMAATVTAQRELAAATLTPAGTAPRAGISARAPIRVQPLPERLARQLHGSPDFARLSHRCGVCHTTPDPKLHVASQWPDVVARMAGTMEAAGLLPLGEPDRLAVLRVLREHALPQ
jgi:hypothetical protein